MKAVENGRWEKVRMEGYRGTDGKAGLTRRSRDGGWTDSPDLFPDGMVCLRAQSEGIRLRW